MGGTDEIAEVSILVLVDAALRLLHEILYTSHTHNVSILVLVDAALRPEPLMLVLGYFFGFQSLF